MSYFRSRRPQSSVAFPASAARRWRGRSPRARPPDRCPSRRSFFERVVGERSHVRAIRTHQIEIARGLRVAGIECRFVLEAAAHARERNPLPVGGPAGVRVVPGREPADGTGSATRLTDSLNPQFATSITPDGTRVIIVETTPTQARDLRLLTLTPTPPVEPLVETRFDERGGVVSSDGRWLAYESNSSGRYRSTSGRFPPWAMAHSESRPPAACSRSGLRAGGNSSTWHPMAR